MSLSRNALAGIVQVSATGALLFILYQYLAHALGTEGIGLWSVIFAAANSSRLADFGFGVGIVKYVAHDVGAGRLAEARLSVVMAFVCALGFTALAASGLWLLSKPILQLALNREEPVRAAMQIVPIALVSVWVASGAAVFLGALDGLNRIDLRAAITVGGSLVQLIAAWGLVPAYGVRGLALGHFLQSCLVLLAAFVVLKMRLGSLFKDAAPWSYARFTSMLRYGGGVQIAAIAQMTIDPLVRILLSRFGSLDLTGIYEMATRLVYQARTVLVAGYQAIIPYVASVHGSGENAHVKEIYEKSYALVCALGIPYFAIITAALPAISHIWLGEMSDDFLWMGALVTLTWATNALIVPAYYVFLALGNVRWNAISQIVSAATTLIFTAALGARFGGYGVVVGALLGVIAGALVVMIAFHKYQGIPLYRAVPRLGVVPALAAAAGLLMFLVLRSVMVKAWAVPVAVVAPLLLVVVTGFALFAWEPYVRSVIARVSRERWTAERKLED